MLAATRTMWREHRILFLAFTAALVVTVFFAVRMIVFTIYWSDPAHHHQPLEGWMTPRYIVHSYDLPPEVVQEALNLKEKVRKRRTLAEIAHDTGLSLEEMTRRVERAAETHHGNSK